MTNIAPLAATRAPGLRTPLAVLFGATVLLGACGSDPKVQTTTTEQSTTQQIVPATVPTTTTTITKTQHYVL